MAAYPGQGGVYKANPIRAQFQSIDDFMREQEQLDAVKSAEMKARAQAVLANSNTKKFKRPPVDAEAAAAEARAVAELGQINWTGRLLGKTLSLQPTNQIIVLTYHRVP
jgi:hypothetical protein